MMNLSTQRKSGREDEGTPCPGSKRAKNESTKEKVDNKPSGSTKTRVSINLPKVWADLGPEDKYLWDLKQVLHMKWVVVVPAWNSRFGLSFLEKSSSCWIDRLKRVYRAAQEALV
ncbi:hypothetical protein N7495_008997 [Penicillium taxi]|uniref:uncharacterized protein n=1 Tax=Penicillium taxi TaxID=168475 RepID=UPI0025454A01|nr:uncharacterized protein N7495_008997 [Penicillium taxi]KAJ5888956.1 hypothetical protein N7495_008997 [Penicillium taxi]